MKTDETGGDGETDAAQGPNREVFPALAGEIEAHQALGGNDKADGGGQGRLVTLIYFRKESDSSVSERGAGREATWTKRGRRSRPNTP